MPIVAAAAIGTGGSIYAANKASKAQEKAARQAQETMRPYTETGKGAIYSLAQLYGIPTEGNPNPGEAFNEASLDQFRKSPDYAFAESEGRRQLMFGQAKLGDLKSGNTGRDLVSFGQGMANQTFGNYFSRLMQLAQIGQGGATGTANAQMAAGQANAAGTVGASNALNAGIGSATNNLMLYNLLNKQGSGSVYGGQMGSQIPGGYTSASPGELPWQTGGYSPSLLSGQGGIGHM